LSFRAARCGFGVSVGEDTPGVRIADDETNAKFFRDGEQGPGEFLFQEVAGYLQGAGITLADGGFGFSRTVSIRAYGDGEIADFSFFDQPFQGLKDLVIFQDFHIGVVKLVQIYVVSAEPPEALFASVTDVVRVEALREFFSAQWKEVSVEVHTDLGGNCDVVTLFRKGLDQDFFAVAIVVGIGGVEEGNA
jgi:hypothetical protein